MGRLLAGKRGSGLERTVDIQGQPVVYVLTYKRVKNINFRLGPAGELHVSAPRGLLPQMVDEAVRGKGAWLMRAFHKREAAAARLDLPVAFAQEERISLLGETVTLQLQAGSRAGIRRAGDVLIVTLPDPAEEGRRRRLVQDYAQALLQPVLEQSLTAMLALAAPLGIDRPQLKTRWMKSRWGTCHCQKGLIVLNRALAALPRDVIDAVVLHELIHFRHPDHSRAFYAACEAVMPDFRRRQAQLAGVSPRAWCG